MVDRLVLVRSNIKSAVNLLITRKIEGDPNDRSLRKVEKEVLIPQIMRDRAKKEKCGVEVKAFEECCKESSILMVVKCRNENSLLKNCLAGWYKNE
jgi:COX assembly mitochondrial protein 1